MARIQSRYRWLPEHFTGLAPEMAQALLKPDGGALIDRVCRISATSSQAQSRSPETYLLASGRRMV
jgi:hypothetical protein